MTLTTRITAIEKRHEPAWVPFKPTSPTPKVRGCILRSLELRGLELTVKDWTDITNLGYTDHPEVKAVLDRHSHDELAHDTQLQYLAEWMGHTQVSKAAQTLIDEWAELKVDPMVKKLCLEAGVFFQILGSWLRYTSSPEIATVRGWVMGDESLHVAVARLLVSDRGHRVTKPALDLTVKTLQFIFSDPEDELTYWGTLAYKTLVHGRASEGTELSVAPVMEFFTQESNRDIPYLVKP